MKKLTMAVAVAVAMLFGSAATARAESGAFIGGGRLALNYSTLYNSTTSSSGYTDTYSVGSGGLGFEGGVVGRLAVIEGQMGVHVGANFIYRSVFNGTVYYGTYGTTYYHRDNVTSSEMAVGVPILFEINPFVLGGLNSQVYEMIFIQIGLQVDYSFGYSQENNNKKATEALMLDRNPLGVGIVIGAVGYFNSHLSLDVRYNLGLVEYYSDITSKWYPYTYNIGLSFYL